MRTFLTRLFIFLVATAVSLVVIANIGGMLLKRKEPFRLPDDKRHVFLGHSHTQFTFNPAYIDSSVNLGSSGEAYMYTYVKIAELIRQNPGRPMTLFVEFSNNNLGGNMDQWTWGDVYVQDRFRRFHSFIGMPERRILYAHNLRKSVLTDLQSAFYNYYNLVKLGDIRNPGLIGGYEPLPWSRTDSLLRHPPPGTQRDAYLREISEVNVEYLRKIISMCREHGLQIYLTRGPLHEAYPLHAVEDIFQEVRKKNFGDVEFLDLGKFPLPNEEFADLEHTNDKGAAKVSRFFGQMIRDGLLLQSDKQAFINDRLRQQTRTP